MWPLLSSWMELIFAVGFSIWKLMANDFIRWMDKQTDCCMNLARVELQAAIASNKEGNHFLPHFKFAREFHFSLICAFKWTNQLLVYRPLQFQISVSEFIRYIVIKSVCNVLKLAKFLFFFFGISGAWFWNEVNKRFELFFHWIIYSNGWAVRLNYAESIWFALITIIVICLMCCVLCTLNVHNNERYQLINACWLISN